MSTNFPRLLLRYLTYAQALLGGIFILFLVLATINTFFLTLFTVDGHSMDPTLHDGQHLVVNLQAYNVTAPQVGDVVIVAYAGDRSIRFVKRIQGIPGETVLVDNQSLILREGFYYVVGDNREFSTDSRTYGPIARDQILGKVLLTGASASRSVQ